ncbi:hypothetical protein LEN26_009402 [Aphanomyces euteiches]|nr:hypothetical protein AeMF1_013824 [Aphanomyces euteiches]KAH9126203.1 hypothetical protein LEN26_009402 [Aphanomyces euteiches]KAH9194508.1 hypothetical protein AeNC1_003511 [Aphanomyces euteiches]
MLQHTKFYDLMGVQPDATPEQLKKAYRKKALELHPDKRGNSPEAQEEFTTMKHAYDVLSDPHQREIYDATGEEGLKMMNGFGEMNAEQMMAAAVSALSSMGSGSKCTILLGVALICCLLLLMPIFLCLRADHTVDWSWIQVFIPMWIFDGLYLCSACCSLGSKDDDSSDNDDTSSSKATAYTRVLSKSLMLLKALLFVTCQIFIAMKLQGTVDWSCVTVLVPYFVLESLLLVEKILVGWTLASSMPDATPWLVASVVYSSVHTVLRLIFAVLVGLKVDDTLSSSWGLVFLPVWIAIGLSLWSTIRGIQSAARLAEDDQVDWRSLVCIGVGWVIFLSPFIVLAFRLEDSFSSMYVLLPWFILAGGLLLVLGFCLCCVLRVPQEDSDEGAAAAAATAAAAEGNNAQERHDQDVYHVVDDTKV